MADVENGPRTHVVSYSSLTTHRHCPQRWQYAYVQRLKKVDPDDVKAELEYGSWWHALRAADSIERGRLAHSLVYCPDELRTTDDGPRISTDPGDWETDLHEREEDWDLRREVLAAAEKWWATLTPRVKDVWAERVTGGDTLVERLTYMDARWFEMWGDDIEHERPLGVEVYWRRELPALPQAEGEVDPDTAILGYVDEVYLDTRRGLVVARDHKTGKQLGTQSSADDMMDSQLQVYAWGAAPMVAGWEHGPIRAVAYDRVRTKKPTTPKLNVSGTLSKSVTDFDLHTYRTWAAGEDGHGQPYAGLKKDGSGAGRYVAEESMIQALSDPAAQSAWFQRTLTPLNRNIVRAHLRAAVDTSIDITLTRTRLAITGEGTRNLTSACRWCDFAKLCRAQMIGGPEGEYDLAALGLSRKPDRDPAR